MSKIGRRISKLFSGKKDKDGKKGAHSKESTGATTGSAVAADAGAATAATPASGARRPNIAIVIYSMYGHVAKLAESVLEGAKAAGADVTIYQIPETLPKEVLEAMHAPPKPAYPIITPEKLAEHDAFLLGIPTRYGNQSAQWRAFWDATGQLWQSGALHGKYAGVFIPVASANLEEPHGGSPWGAGVFAGGDGSRQPSALELEMGRLQGKSFAELVARAV